MTDETIAAPPDDDADTDDGDNEPVEGDTTEEDSTPEPDVRSREVPPEAF